MITKKILLACLIYSTLTNSLSAADTKNYCELQDIPYKKVVKINDFPSFFYKVHPSGDYVAYIGLEGNQLLDLNTGKTYPLPGHIDPTFTPDGKNLIIPITDDQLKGYDRPTTISTPEEEQPQNPNASKTKIAVYPFDKFKNAAKANDRSIATLNKLHSKPSFIDPKNNGVYQSSTVNSDGEISMITDQDGISGSRFAPKGNSYEVTSPVQKLCSNIENFKSDLPMLSKDGRFLSVFNNDTNTTQIYHLTEDGECDLSADLGIKTGKVSFNANSSQITFHVDEFAKSNQKYFSGVASDLVKNIYVVNLTETDNGENKVLIPTTWAKATNIQKKGDGAFYPDFSGKSNDIVTLLDQDNNYQFAKIEQKHLNFQPYLQEYESHDFKSADGKNISCIKFNDVGEKQYVLAEMWNAICRQNDKVMTINEGAIVYLGLKEKNCGELVRENWGDAFIKKLKEQDAKGVDLSFLDGVKIQDLIAACPKTKTASTKEKTQVVGVWKKKDPKTHQQLVTQKCMTCHSREMEYQKEVPDRVVYGDDGEIKSKKTATRTFKLTAFDPKNIDYQTAEKMAAAVTMADPKKRMPKGGSLTDQERRSFILYSVDKMAELPSEGGPTITVNGPAYEEVHNYSDKKIEEMITENKNLNKETIDGLSEAAKISYLESIKRSYYCQYAQRGCKEHIQEKMNFKRQSLVDFQNIPLDAAKEETLKKYELSLKCAYFYESSYEMCKDVKKEY